MSLQMQLLCFLGIAKINFIDTDFIFLVTAQMSYYSNSLMKCKNVTQKIMDTFRKNGFMKVKMPLKFFKFKLIGKY